MARRPVLFRGSIDLDACACVDGNHWWDSKNAVYHRKATGSLRGLAVRTMTCVQCGSSKDQVLMWNGELAGSTHYDHDESYIDNARLLDDDHHTRRRIYREEMLRRANLAALDDETPEAISA